MLIILYILVLFKGSYITKSKLAILAETNDTITIVQRNSVESKFALPSFSLTVKFNIEVERMFHFENIGSALTEIK